MARKPPPDTDDISLRFIVDRQDLSLNISCLTPRRAGYGSKNKPLDGHVEARLYGSIVGSPKGKWTAGAIYIVPINGMMASTKPLDDLGDIDTKGPFLVARVFWPEEQLKALAPLISSNRIAEASLRLRKRHLANAVLECVLTTQHHDYWEEEFMFWYGGKGQPVPRLYISSKN